MKLAIVLQEGGGIMSMLPFLAMFAVIYFFMIRPQMKRQKNEKKFQSEITRGSKVIMSSGIHGKVVELNENDGTVVVETSAGKIKFDRSALSMEMTKKLNPVKK
ncbi:MAG: preprotein translocase subunit YajC [Flavobacteriaceae bacterium]|nr:preprotein translocase subunit YajC [Flavobacteriaceae bacterium]